MGTKSKDKSKGKSKEVKPLPPPPELEEDMEEVVLVNKKSKKKKEGEECYFESGVCSVYLWDLDHGFAGVVLIKKAGDTEKIKGCWDSIHVVEVQEKAQGCNAHYKLISTAMLWLQTIKVDSGTMNLGGSLTRQTESDHAVSESSPHIANIRKMVEDMENKMRQTLNEIYFGKTKDVVNDLRSMGDLKFAQKQRQLAAELQERMQHK